MSSLNSPGSIDAGEVKQLFSIDEPGAGSISIRTTVQSDSVLAALFCESVSGSLSVSIRTFGLLESQYSEIIAFPTLSAPTTNLLLEKAALSLDNILVVASWTAACKANLRIKGLQAGETSVRILGANTGLASQTNITTVPAAIISSSLTDRSGIIVKNNSTTGILYIGYTVAETVTGNGYPLGPGESLGIDLASGATLYGRASAGTIDVRIMEASV